MITRTDELIHCSRRWPVRHPTSPPLRLQGRHHRLSAQLRACQVARGRRGVRLPRPRGRVEDQGGHRRLRQERV